MVSTTTVISPTVATQRRTVATMNVHAGTGVPRIRFSCPDSRCITSEIASELNPASRIA
jgi:hypothetical protein